METVNAKQLVLEALASGLDVRADAGDLVVQGPRTLAPLAEQLLDRKAEVLAALEDEETAVAWRMDVMRQQVPATGGIPFLIARRLLAPAGICLSCGDPMAPDRRYRCGPCGEAARRVLAEVREGVSAGGVA